MNAPGLMDISDESRATLNLYGIDEKETEDFGRQCLLARRLAVFAGGFTIEAAEAVVALRAPETAFPPCSPYRNGSMIPAGISWRSSGERGATASRRGWR